MNRYVLSVMLSLYSVLLQHGYAEETKDTATSSLATPSADSQGLRTFAGLRFGVGLSLTINRDSRSQIKTAEIVSGITRVSFEQNNEARIMLESHYFFTPKLKNDGLFGVRTGNWGIGPFVAVQPGSDEIIDAIGAGFMIGFRRDGSDQPSSWNFGVGAIVDPNVTVLGDGFTENAAPPENETQVRLKQTSQRGIVLLTSFSF